METLILLRASIPKEQKRFIKFLIVGVIGFIVDFGSFNLLGSLIKFDGIIFDLASFHIIIGPKVIAQAISFALATCSNFLWNYFWIYREARTQPVLPRVGLFIGVSVIGLAIRTPIFTFLYSFIHQTELALGMHNAVPFLDVGSNLALACSVLVVLMWNFFINRKLTYGDVK